MYHKNFALGTWIFPMKDLYICIAVVMLSGCSVLGKSGVEIAPYRVIKSDNQQKTELRHYERFVLVSTPMYGGMDEGKKGAFYKLFDYISGKNTERSKIAMTAPVFLDNTGVEIPITASVFIEDIAEQSTMSFVLPASFTLDTAPLPQDPDVKIHEMSDYTAAVITFSGVLEGDSIDKHRTHLETWIESKGYKITGPYKAAGYNPPFTIPALRRNEVLIPINMP
tara:strand:- start:1802 stop:2473 length:672 start_codon:yes stop_codon:yes gene_type:complete